MARQPVRVDDGSGPPPIDHSAVPAWLTEKITRVQLPPGNDLGRPTDLTDAVANRILAALRVGASRSGAANWAGKPAETLSRWMHKPGEPYETFQRLVREAESFAELRNVAVAGRAEKPQDALAFLERRFPKRWSRHAAAFAASINVDARQQTNNISIDLAEMLDEIESRRRGVAPGPRDPRPRRLRVSDMIESGNGDRPTREPVT